MHHAVQRAGIEGAEIDDVVIGTNFGQLVDPFDVSSVEVDRGPSGIFYGRNSIGGVLNIHRTKPTHKWGLAVDVGYGSYNQNIEKAVLNGDTTSFNELSSSDQAALQQRAEANIAKITALQRGNVQTQLLDELTSGGVSSLADVDFERAEREIHARLAPLS